MLQPATTSARLLDSRENRVHDVPPVRLSDLRCARCSADVQQTHGSFDYTQQVGLDPTIYTVILDGVRLRRCACGTEPMLEDVPELHRTLASHLAVVVRNLDASVLRFFRATLQLTQAKFGELIGVSAARVSQCEQGSDHLRCSTSIHIRLRVLQTLQGSRGGKALLEQDARHLLDAVFAASDTPRLRMRYTAMGWERSPESGTVEAAVV